MLVLSLRQNRRLKSLLSLPNRTIIFQCQTRKFSALSKINGVELGRPDAEVSDDSTIPKRVDSPWKVGARVLAKGGVEDAVTDAFKIGANSFAFFLKLPLQWKSPSLQHKSISEFKKRMKQYGYANNMVLPNSTVIIELGDLDRDKREKSYDCFLDDLQRCETLGLELYNFRPGLTFGRSIESCITLIAECINRAHRATRTVSIVLKNTEGGKRVIGSKFSELAGIIHEVEDKTRVGVCLDTSCAFSAGYDIRTKEGWDTTMNEFDKEIGLNYLRGMHLSDSRTTCNSNRDLRLSIGIGNLGVTTFQHILQDPRTRNIPLILATPGFLCFQQPEVVWVKEIGVLQALTNPAIMNPENDLQSLVLEIKETAREEKSKKKAETPKRKRDRLFDGVAPSTTLFSKI